MATTTKTYRVTYEMDEAGHWLATILGVPGCHTHGRSLARARARAREALAVCIDNAGEARLTETFRLGRTTLALTERAKAAKSRADKAQNEAQRLLRDAVRELVKANLSHRDAAVVLGLSHQRVAQLASEARSHRTKQAHRRDATREG